MSPCPSLPISGLLPRSSDDEPGLLHPSPKATAKSSSAPACRSGEGFIRLEDRDNPRRINGLRPAGRLLPTGIIGSLCMLLTLFAPVVLSGQVVIFEEDFGDPVPGSPPSPPPFPAGWTLINQDGLTPDGSVAVFTDAWITLVDFNDSTDVAAASTSWYAPFGQADDWLITPQISLPSGIGAVLQWEARTPDLAFPDGYEVRISTGNPTIADFDLQPVLLTIPAENVAFTLREVDLSTYAGQEVYLAFRNNSFDKFILFIDDVRVVQLLADDAAVTDALLPSTYQLVPRLQGFPLQLGATIENAGSNALSNAVLMVEVFDPGDLGTPLYTATSAPFASIASGASEAVTFPDFVPTELSTGLLQVTYTVTSDTDGNAANDSLTVGAFRVTPNILGRYADGAPPARLGIGGVVPPQEGEIGSLFDLLQPARLASAGWVGGPFPAGDPGGDYLNHLFRLRARSVTAGVPNALLGTTADYELTAYTDDFVDVDQDFPTPIPLAPGAFFLSMVEDNLIMKLGTSPDRFFPGTQFVDFPFTPAGTWNTLESIGEQFEVGFYLRAVFTVETLTVGLNIPTAGTVISDVGAINCGMACTEDFVYDTVVQLTPAPAPGFLFTGWTGDACTVLGDVCQVTMADSATVTANFAPEPEATVTAILSDLPDPSLVGEPVTVTVEVTPMMATRGTPTGTVAVSDGVDGCVVSLVAGSGNCQVNLTNVGSRDLVATYSGDSLFLGSASLPESHSVALRPTSATITSDLPDPSTVGEAFTVAFTVVEAGDRGNLLPSGSVTVSDGVNSCAGPLAAGAGSCQLTLDTAGSRNLTASYDGDAFFDASISALEPHQVDQIPTLTAITADLPDPSAVNQQVTVSFSVKGTALRGVEPTGDVTVSDGVDSCVGSLAAGSGSCTLALTTVGARTLTANYAGDALFAGSISPGEPHTVVVQDTILTLSTNTPQPVPTGRPIDFDFLLELFEDRGFLPTGDVTVSLDSGDSCAGDVQVGMCSLSVDTPGTYLATAQYPGDDNNGPATSAPVQIVVGSPVEIPLPSVPIILATLLSVVAILRLRTR